ncbi:MAG: phosphatidate cytidylyltransferase [Candidatus Izemoplasmataceae bacterium]
MDIFITMLIVVLYFGLILALIPVILKSLLRVPSELVRKFQHIGFASSIFIFSERGHEWVDVVIMIVIFGTFIFFMMWLIEKAPNYNKFFVDRDKLGGEMKRSLLMAMGVFALLFTLFGGLLPNASYTHVVIAVMSWGIGDAIAAIFGKYLGKRKLNSPGVDPNKTWLGSVTMSISVAIVVFFMVLFYAFEPWWVALISAVIIAVVATSIEAYSKKGLDTLWIPLGVASVLYGLNWMFIWIMGGL